MEYKEQSNKKKNWGILGGIAALVFSFGGKLKLLLPLLKLLKLGKVGGTIWSMLLMVGAYAIIYPWTFSIGVVVMLLIHEMGHVLAAKKKKLPVSAPAFIPFLGALITMKRQPQDAQTEAYIALGGPFLGTIGALLTLGLGIVTGFAPLYVIAWVGFFLNLINLLPIHPLDGGRIVTAISRWLWLVGLVGGLLVILYLRAFIFLFFWVLFAIELYQAFVSKRKKKLRESMHKLTVSSSLFEENYMPIPGKEHFRKLSFTTYCNLADQATYVDVIYPGLGPIGTIQFPFGNVAEVYLKGAVVNEAGEVDLRIALQFEPEHHMVKSDAYYQVPARTRILYGLAYFGLAALLGSFLYITGIVAPLPNVIG